MRFKPELVKEDFFRLHPSLVEIVANFYDHVLGEYGIIPSITSMIRPKTWDSGVHETGRALDVSRYMHDFSSIKAGAYRIEGSIPEKDCVRICQMLNAVYPRYDGHETVKWHSSGDERPWHFHFQVPHDPKWSVWERSNLLYAKTLQSQKLG